MNPSFSHRQKRAVVVSMRKLTRSARNRNPVRECDFGARRGGRTRELHGFGHRSAYEHKIRPMAHEVIVHRTIDEQRRHRAHVQQPQELRVA